MLKDFKENPQACAVFQVQCYFVAKSTVGCCHYCIHNIEQFKRPRLKKIAFIISYGVVYDTYQ